MPNPTPICEEFPVPGGMVIVDVTHPQDTQNACGIHIYYSDDNVTDGSDPNHLIAPSKKQWNLVKFRVMEFLENNLE